MKKAFYILVFIAMMAPLAVAGDVELEGDRPDFTESANVVPFGSVQLEGGYSFFGAYGLDEHVFGELLLRVGVYERLELRLGANSMNWTDDGTEEVFGKDDPSMGAKIQILYGLEQFNFLSPDMSLILGTSIPVGTDDFTNEKWQPEAKLCVSWAVTAWFTFGSNLNYTYAYDIGKDDWFSQFSGSTVFSFAITEELGAYGEYIIYAPESSGGGSANYLSAGLTWLVTKTVQVDGRFGIRIHGDNDYFTGIGFVFLWPEVWNKSKAGDEEL